MKEKNFYVGEFYKNTYTNFIYEISSYFDEVYIFKSISTGGTMHLGIDKIKKEFIQVNKDGTPINKFAEANKYMQIENKNEALNIGDFIKNFGNNSDGYVYFIDDIDFGFQNYFIRRNFDGKSLTIKSSEILMHFSKCDENGNKINNNIKTKIMKNTDSINSSTKQLQKIQINSTVDAILVSPKMYGTMALVDLLVLKRITSYMQSDSFAAIRDHFVGGLKNSKDINQYIEMMKEEILFHESVNLISTIELPEQEIKEEIKTSIH